MVSPSAFVRDVLAKLGPHLAAEVVRVLGASSSGERLSTPFELERLSSRREIYRVRATVKGKVRSVVIKQLAPDVAYRARLAADRWLPALELQHIAPRLLTVVAGSEVESVWHVYEDIRGAPLDTLGADPHAVSETVETVAQLHANAVGHHVVAECHRDGEDFGIHYFSTNVTDALNLLGDLRSPAVRVSSAEAALRDRLRRRLDALLHGTDRRGQLLAEVGGPATMLHGDLWSHNVLVDDSRGATAVRLIDWDHVGAGPACYDLSTFLYRFDRVDRPWILDLYRASIAPVGWRLPHTAEFNVLSDTCECARYANRIIWPAIALLREQADWAFSELERIEEWFEALHPVLDAQEARGRGFDPPPGYPAGAPSADPGAFGGEVRSLG